VSAALTLTVSLTAPTLSVTVSLATAERISLGDTCLLQVTG
jgi:hypothetical protein